MKAIIPDFSTLSKTLVRETLKKRSKLDFGDNDNIDNNNDDDDDGDDGDDDEDYLEDKLELARDEDSVITEAKVIFHRDHKTNKVYMVAQLDEIDLDEISDDGQEMFDADIIFRICDESYLNPKIKSAPINPTIFKKSNWKTKN